MALQAEKLIDTVIKHEILYVSTSKSYKEIKRKKVRGVTSPMSWIWTMRKEVTETLHLFTLVLRFNCGLIKQLEQWK